MKTKIWMILSMCIFFCCTGSITSLPASGTDENSKEIKLQCPPSLKSIAQEWVSQFNSNQADYHATLEEHGSLILNSQFKPGEFSWKTIAGRNPILFVNNTHNLQLQEGLSESALRALINDQDNTVSICLSDHQGTLEAFRQFSGRNPEEMNNILILSEEKMQEKMFSSENALCIMPWSFLDDPAELFQNGRIVKIDLNNDGIIDPVENIYRDINTFMRGVWIGKYPKALSINLMLSSRNETLNAAEESFVRFILTEGQADLASHDFAVLTYTEQISNLAKIPAQPVMLPMKMKKATNRATFLALGTLIILLVLVWYLSKWKRISHRVKTASQYQPIPLGPEQIKTPGGVLFNHAHTWTFMEQDGAVKLGIDDFVQHVTGPITRIEMKPDNYQIKKGEVLAVVSQNGKRIEVLSPVSGKITENNAALQNTPALLNQSPFDRGWICRIEPSNWSVENQSLIIPSEYRTWLKNEFVRLKDFLQQSLNHQQTQLAPISLNDGGEILDEILSQFGPETWEDFGEHFMKPSKLN